MLYRLVAWLPFPLLYALAWLGYGAVYHLARYRRAVVAQNLTRGLPEKTAAERKRIEKAFYLQLCQTALEILKARRMRPEDFLQRSRLLNPEVVERATAGFTRSAIVVTIHQGNWEWMLHGTTVGLGVPVDPVYKPLHNPTVDALVHEIRGQFGSRPLAMAEAPRDILRRRREFRLFVMVADQSPTNRERGYWTRFLHQDARFYLGAETIARATGFPVLFAQCRRLRRGFYTVEFKELASPPYEAEGHTITDRYVQLAEAAIAAEPQSWLWSNRRWKRQRPVEGTDADS
ncbi:lysophospholipid acyltransferase family protein [Haliea sp. E17]|uniref:lysophospholipid acyltransferase family protein n=1 Tax=Haliea sp. E17 TaxID=3401576 RepID=UPI003AAE5CB2